MARRMETLDTVSQKMEDIITANAELKRKPNETNKEIQEIGKERHGNISKRWSGSTRNWEKKPRE